MNKLSICTQLSFIFLRLYDTWSAQNNQG